MSLFPVCLSPISAFPSLPHHRYSLCPSLGLPVSVSPSLPSLSLFLLHTLLSISPSDRSCPFYLSSSLSVSQAWALPFLWGLLSNSWAKIGLFLCGAGAGPAREGRSRGRRPTEGASSVLSHRMSPPFPCPHCRGLKQLSQLIQEFMACPALSQPPTFPRLENFLIFPVPLPPPLKPFLPRMNFAFSNQLGKETIIITTTTTRVMSH